MQRLFLTLTISLLLAASACTINQNRKGQTAYLTGDYTGAYKYYRTAANGGSAKAQNELGWMYEHGKGVAQNNEEALAWYRKAAEKDYAAAQYNLGWMYEQGKGVEQNRQTAYMWYLLASKDKKKRAVANKSLARLRPNLSAEQIATMEQQAGTAGKKSNKQILRFLSSLKPDGSFLSFFAWKKDIQN